MHELTVTEGILRVALASARQHQAQRITAIELTIGALTSIIDDSVQFYFDLLSPNTIAAGAVLHFNRAPATAACQACGCQWPVMPPLPSACPQCGRQQLVVSGGDQFQVTSIEIDE